VVKNDKNTAKAQRPGRGDIYLPVVCSAAPKEERELTFWFTTTPATLSLAVLVRRDVRLLLRCPIEWCGERERERELRAESAP
jgi:hypothetical protein